MLKKAAHPRIKYSKLINPVNVTSTTTHKLETSQTSTVPTTQYLITRKVIPTQALPTTSTPRVGVANPTILKVFTDYEGNSSIATIPTQAGTSDLTVGVIDDLDYSGIDDIDLPEVNFSDPFRPEQNTNSVSSNSNDLVGGSHTEKYTIFGEGNIVVRKQDSQTMLINESSISDSEDGKQYACQHCGKRYRWKSTLRRHENVECGGKEPVHQCPYCPYKAKQRGNLGVHVRKHHSNLPPLATRRNKMKLDDESSKNF